MGHNLQMTNLILLQRGINSNLQALTLIQTMSPPTGSAFIKKITGVTEAGGTVNPSADPKETDPRLLCDILWLILCFHWALNSAWGFCANTQTALWVILTAGEVFICLSELSHSPGALIGIWALPLESSRAVNIRSYLHGRGVLWHNNIPSSANAKMRVSDTWPRSKPGRKGVE